MADSMSDLLNSVDQFINDENKIVTYQFLSQTCGIHVNLAKNVLEQYAEKAKKTDPTGMQVIYSLGGYVGKNLRITLVTEEKLKEAKSHLDRVLYSHVYSVQKGKIGDFSLLHNSNRTDLKKTIQQCSGYSAIECPAARLKTSEELEAERPKAQATKNPEPISKQASKVKAEPPAQPKEADAKQEPTATTEDNNKNGPVTTTNAKTAANKTGNKATTAIANMFAKQQVKDPEKKKKEDEEKKKKEEAAKAEADKKKSPVANGTKRIVREPSSDEEEAMEEDSSHTNGHAKNGSNKRLKLSEERNKPEKPPPKSKAKQSKLTTTKTSSKSAKPQRKRIQQFSDSESSDGGENEDMMVSSPEMAIQPAAPSLEDDVDFLEATQVEEPTSQKSKKRKLVSKTVMGDDGFVVTTKEYVTCEEEEDQKDPEPGSPAKKAPPAPAAAATKKPSPPAKGKQQSIMNFFTRK